MEDNMSNIINNFKTMINSSNSNSPSSNTPNTSSSDFNITPEMLSNLLGSFQNPSVNSDSSDLQNTNFTQAPSNSQNINNTDSTSSSSQNCDFSSSIDFETILKIKSIMETLNKKDDPRSNLLYSLKPYLRQTRQKKLDQYVNLFKITQVTNLFKKEKGDEK